MNWNIRASRRNLFCLINYYALHSAFLKKKEKLFHGIWIIWIILFCFHSSSCSFCYFSMQHKTLKQNKVICWTLVLLSRSCYSFEIKNLHKSYFQFFFAPENHFIHKTYFQAHTGHLKRSCTSPWQHLMQCCGLAKFMCAYDIYFLRQIDGVLRLWCPRFK